MGTLETRRARGDGGREVRRGGAHGELGRTAWRWLGVVLTLGACWTSADVATAAAADTSAPSGLSARLGEARLSAVRACGDLWERGACAGR